MKVSCKTCNNEIEKLYAYERRVGEYFCSAECAGLIRTEKSAEVRRQFSIEQDK